MIVSESKNHTRILSYSERSKSLHTLPLNTLFMIQKFTIHVGPHPYNPQRKKNLDFCSNNWQIIFFQHTDWDPNSTVCIWRNLCMHVGFTFILVIIKWKSGVSSKKHSRSHANINPFQCSFWKNIAKAEMRGAHAHTHTYAHTHTP